MSVIRKIPYIETVVSVLSKTLMSDLKTIINEGGDNVSLDFATLTSSYKNKVTPVYFNLENGTKTGILIWNEPITGAYDKEETYNTGDYAEYNFKIYICLEDNVTGSWDASKWKRVSYCTLICYHRFPDLMLLDIDTRTHKYEKVNEYCTIDELRRIVFASDKADLVNGKIPQDQLPSYVDDVVNGYLHEGKFYEEDTYTTEIPAEEGKIYVDLATNITYRWSGLAYIQIGGGSVEANPTLAGTEPELTGLQIGDTKYKVPKGSYVVTATDTGYITSTEYNYIDSNFNTIPCFVTYGGYIFRISSKIQNNLYADIISRSLANNQIGIYGLYIESSNYRVTLYTSMAIKVDANPTLTGTENYLSKIQIKDTKYKVLILLKFTNVSASSWVSDSTVTGFSYKCVLSCTGITADSVVYVKFGDTEVASGNYSSTVETGADTVTIWSKVNTSITIPLIKEI